MNSKSIFSKVFLFAVVALCCGNFRTAAQTTPDPGLMGTHTVVKAEYNLGNLSYSPPPAAMFPSNMEERGSVHYPADLTSGPFPVIIWLHGRHETCYDSVTLASSSGWPCTGRKKAIPSYAGYDYAARTLASHGYIVISISANAINAIDGGLSDAGMNARGVLTQHHLDLWNTWNTTGGAPFGTTFVGRLNMQNIGTMGHSRGGEGVIFQAEYNRTLGSPYGIKAILTLAPVDFYRHFVNGIPLLNIAPYCDGDVADLQGVHFYDDTRYADPTDESPKHNILMLGANHNFFNTVWSPNPYVGGGGDDWGDYGWSNADAQCGISKKSRFDTVKQRAAYNAYAAAFYRLYLGHENQFAPILEVNDIVPPVSSTLDSSNVFVSYHPGTTDRKDINRVDLLSELSTNTLSGAVVESGLTTADICNGTTMPLCAIGTNPAQEPHQSGLGEMRMTWDASSDYYENSIPAASQNLSSFKNLVFRAAVNFGETALSVKKLDYTVQLIDAAGKIGAQTVGNHTQALFYEPGTESGDLPKTVLNTVSIPLDSFAGVDLTKIAKVKFLFDKSAAGGILISDLAVANSVCGNFSVTAKDSIGKLNKVFFTGKATSSSGDTLVYLWKFGDPASGTKDTSTAINPTHTYSVKGTYTACMIVQVKRKAGSALSTCIDSFCTTITVSGLGTHDAVAANIRIIPNPARDYLQINGTEPTDVLRLTDLYGRVVFTKTLTEPVVHLPQALASGVYYATITTDAGNVYQKIVITR